MRNLTLLLVLLVSFSCKMRHNASLQGGGSYIQRVNSNQATGVKLIKFGDRIGVIFPAEFAKKIFRNNTESITYYTPDTALVKRIDKDVNLQYCNAQFDYWARLLKGLNSESIEKQKLTIKQEKLVNSISSGFCTYWHINVKNYDRQYLGYIDKNGDKTIYMKYIDFSSDPHQLKSSLNSSWILGWHGWFYSNVRELYFNVNKNLLIIK